MLAPPAADSSFELDLVHYLPLATTLVCSILGIALLRRYRSKRGALHLLWWTFGMFTYGTGTAIESWITFSGNSLTATKLWYVAGALFGGYPLAQGSVYLLLPRQRAQRLTLASLPLVLAVAVLVLLSPADVAALEPRRPTGAVLAWSWLRGLTPLINLYALAFLVGGAALSAFRYARSRRPGDRWRSWGNVSIALGGLLPGVGGTLAKAGNVEALYVAELIGSLAIGLGFFLCVSRAASVGRTG